MKFHRTPIALVPFIALLLLAGCATLQEKKHSQSLEKRVSEYMQAQIDRKWDKVYTFFDSSYRKTVSQESFAQTPRNIAFKAFKVEEIKVSPSENQATVKVKIDIEFQSFTFPDAPQTQKWIKENGNWFLKKVKQQMTPFSLHIRPAQHVICLGSIQIETADRSLFRPFHAELDKRDG